MKGFIRGLLNFAGRFLTRQGRWEIFIVFVKVCMIIWRDFPLLVSAALLDLTRIYAWLRFKLTGK